MILSFTAKWADGQPIGFPERILAGLYYSELFSQVEAHDMYYHYLNELIISGCEVDERMKLPYKIHTIRNDKHDRWTPGRLIHFRIFNWTKRTLQFAPVIPCKSIQKIGIEHHFLGDPDVGIDGRLLSSDEISKLAMNDGFEDADKFFNIFDTNTAGYTKIIHWTDLKY